MPENINVLQQRKAIIVNGYAVPQITAEQLAEWAEDLTYVSCFSYGYKTNGDLVEIDDENLLSEAGKSGVAPLMVLTPFDENGAYSYDLVREVFTNPVMRDRLINNVVLKAVEKNYFGVVFNFGYIADGDNQQFVITVSKTAARFNRKGKLVIVSIIAGMNDAGIDYEALGRAANFIELRSFQWEQSQAPPAPIAPIDRIREAVSKVTALADPRFILLGLPNYGYDWTMPYVNGRPESETVSNEEAANLAIRTGAAVQYDETRQSSHFSYTDTAGEMHEVWFDDERSTRAKLELVNEYNLGGVSIFTIMNPFPAGTRILKEMFTVIKV